MMAYKGKFVPKNKEKYVGNIENIVFRSLWERRIMTDLDENPNVLRWSSEELAIPYVSPKDGKIHRYFPDFLVNMKDRDNNIRTALWEIKPYRETLPPKRKLLTEAIKYAVNVAKWDAARAWCAERSVEFRIITEKDIFPDRTKKGHK